MCDMDCVGATWAARLPADATSVGPIDRWTSDPVVQAMTAWDPDAGRLDPGPETGNLLLDAIRSGSPALAAEGPALARRARSLLSVGDPHYSQPSQQLLVDRWTTLGVEVDAPPIDDPGCGHEDYLDPSRRCGYDAIVEVLVEAH